MVEGEIIVKAFFTKPESVTPSISFVIPQKGRLDLFENALQSIARQELGTDDAEEHHSLEVVVVTQDEDPEQALKIVERVLGDVSGLTFKFITAQDTSLSISALRNKAARTSSGTLLAFLDADISLSRNWVMAMSAVLMADEARVLASAMQVAGNEPTTIERIQVALNRMRMDTNVNFLSGHNLLVRRETFEMAGGFPEHLRTCEDSVFTDRVGNLGALFRSSEASYVHLGEDRNLSELFCKEKWRSHSNFATLIGRDVRAVELISFVAPMVVVFALALSVVVFLTGPVMFSFVLLVLALAPVLAYSFRLQLAAKGHLNILSILTYYTTYFVARGIGMTQGVSSAVRIRLDSGNSSVMNAKRDF